MITRCYNSNIKYFHNYGGRGIKVCDRWRTDFMNFYNDMKFGYIKGLHLDRIDVNGNYEPNNCRWVTAKENARNKRNNIYITYNGETKLVKVWAEEFGLDYTTVQQRLMKGYSPKECLFGKTRYDLDRMNIRKIVK